MIMLSLCFDSLDNKRTLVYYLTIISLSLYYLQPFVKLSRVALQMSNRHRSSLLVVTARFSFRHFLTTCMADVKHSTVH